MVLLLSHLSVCLFVFYSAGIEPRTLYKLDNTLPLSYTGSPPLRHFQDSWRDSPKLSWEVGTPTM